MQVEYLVVDRRAHRIGEDVGREYRGREPYQECLVSDCRCPGSSSQVARSAGSSSRRRPRLRCAMAARDGRHLEPEGVDRLDESRRKNEWHRAANWAVRLGLPSRHVPGERPADPDMDAIVAQLREAGLLTIGVDAEGRESWTLTAEGVQVARMLAMGDEATINAILDAVGTSDATRA